MNISSVNVSQSKSIAVVINDSSGQRIEKITLSVDTPIIIGRGWSSDVIINDKFIDSQHMSIVLDESGEIYICDLNTKNGTIVSKQLVTQKTSYEIGKLVRIGDTELRFYSNDDSVPAAIALDFSHGFNRKFGSITALTSITLAALFSLFLSLIFRETQELTAKNITNTLLGFSLALISWSLLAGFIGKLFRNEMRFTSHWVLLCFTIIVVTLSTFILDIIDFNSNGSFFSSLISNTCTALVIFLFSFAAFSFATRISKNKKILLSAILCLVPLAYDISGPLLKKDRELWTYGAKSDTSTMAPVFKIVGSTDYEKHQKGVDDLFRELDKEVQNSRTKQSY